MRIIDLFRPRWRHSDPKVRLEALARMSVGDRRALGALSALARQDPEPQVREAATRRMVDQKILREVARSDPDTSVRLAAVVRLTDEDLLATLAQADGDWRVRWTAVEMISDPAIVELVARTDADEEVRAAATRRVSDPARLAQLAATDPAPDVREAATTCIVDQTRLQEIAANDTDPDVRRAAIGRVADEAILAQLAQSEPDRGVAKVAVARINACDLLEAVATGARGTEVRVAAARRIGDVAEVTSEDVLALVAQHHPREDTREDATKRVSDPKLLGGIAGVTEGRPRKRALRRLFDRDVLKALVADARGDGDLREAATERLGTLAGEPSSSPGLPTG